MGEQNKPKRTVGDFFYGAIGAVVPSCGTALRLVEKGQERPLKLHERLALIYNSPLCPHCSCKRERFDKERQRMREIEASR
ncbi:MAG: hypothetical protein ACON39_09210 [Coraliomargaritaceae bacterium]